MELWERSKSAFWSEWFWLPKNVTWPDLENKVDGPYYPQVSDMYFPFPLALLIYVIRQIVERYFFMPLGLYLGLKNEKPRQAPHNPVLELAYKKHKNPNAKIIEGLVKQVDKDVRQVERWFRIRRNQDRASTMKKFTESGWRFVFYFSAFVYGIVILWNKPWLWTSRLCWEGFPHEHSLSNTVYWYYLIEISFYWSLMFSQFMDVKRKDFTEMFVHHAATISLLFFSWCANVVRIGAVILVIHDCCDFWLEAAKMAKYVQFHKICEGLFAIFGVLWFFTRLIFFPYKAIFSSMFESTQIVGFYPALVFFNGWLLTLLILHGFWFSLIVKVTYKAFTSTGEIEGDVRSSTEEEVTPETDEDPLATANHVDHLRHKSG
ncbi:hypothetical protein CHS0354_023198 [Potamilus streckersoni]|uniref:Uncharacterized protein n=1 Tax=Potamilus streckersoni TaxID=2493646 RepID=A0AAE0SJR8_9BIVA|nr:hypothetical protein CHS0354_023198 [Potamilus streckersoni]